MECIRIKKKSSNGQNPDSKYLMEISRYVNFISMTALIHLWKTLFLYCVIFKLHINICVYAISMLREKIFKNLGLLIIERFHFLQFVQIKFVAVIFLANVNFEYLKQMQKQQTFNRTKVLVLYQQQMYGLHLNFNFIKI